MHGVIGFSQLSTICFKFSTRSQTKYVQKTKRPKQILIGNRYLIIQDRNNRINRFKKEFVQNKEVKIKIICFCSLVSSVSNIVSWNYHHWSGNIHAQQKTNLITFSSLSCSAKFAGFCAVNVYTECKYITIFEIKIQTYV